MRTLGNESNGILIDIEAISRLREQCLVPYQSALTRLSEEVAEARQKGPFSVVDKTFMPPSGIKNDYLSQAPYWWPNPDTDDGLPYIHRDGYWNRDVLQLDRPRMNNMQRAVSTLALHYHLTSEESSAEHAAKLLRAWFLDENTRMNPHLRFGQGIPGHQDGRRYGIVETHVLAKIPDAANILIRSAHWSDYDQQALKYWFEEYLEWMLTSELGQSAAGLQNNIGTSYDIQVAAYALFVGRLDVARQLAETGMPTRLGHIAADGRQPLELRRQTPFGYSRSNLWRLFDLATLAERVDVDLWNYEHESGGSIRAGLDYLVKFAEGSEPWPHATDRETEPDWQRLIPLLHRAAQVYYDSQYIDLLDRLDETDSFSADRNRLLYPASSIDCGE